MLTRLRNANAARHDHVLVPASRFNLAIAQILKKEGYLADVQVIERRPRNQLRLQLRYGPRRQQVLSGIRRVSRPGLRIYAKRAALPRVRGGLGVAILSTSRGLMTDREARRLGLGGEVVCYVW
jgi:small subunit ribosomal protein S8